MNQKKVIVLGAGAWGTAISMALQRAGCSVTLIPKFKKEREYLQKNKENIDWLPGVSLSSQIYIGQSLDIFDKNFFILNEIQAIFWTIPVQFSLKEALFLQEMLPPSIPIVICSKGLIFSEKTQKGTFLSKAFQEILPNPLCCLSGPNFAREVAENTYTASVISSSDFNIAKSIAQLIHSPKFRIYLSHDIISVQVAGALKNVLALACGIVTGLNLGQNTRAMILSLGFLEICQISQALGGKIETLLGLSGIGDITLTCFSEKSRNTTFGLRIGKGESIQTLIHEKGGIIEGYFTAKPLYFIARNLNLNTPIFDTIYHILYNEADPLESIQKVLESSTINFERYAL